MQQIADWLEKLNLAQYAQRFESKPTGIFRSRISVSPRPTAHLGRLAEARSAVQAGLALDPTFTIFPFPQQHSDRQPDLSRRARTHL
jgi:hypothetical protein